MQIAMKIEIDNMTLQERDDLFAYLKQLKTLPQRRTAQTFDRYETAVSESLAIATDTEIPSVYVLARTYGPANYKAKVADITKFVEKSVAMDTPFVVKRGVIEQSLKCLSGYLRENNIPITPENVLDNLQYLSHSVDESFPGYAKCRMLHFVTGKQFVEHS